MKLFAAAALTSVVMASSASAAVVTYTDRAEFELAVAGGTPLQQVTFDSDLGPRSELVTSSGVRINSYGTEFVVTSISAGRFLKAGAWDANTPGEADRYQIWTLADDTYAFGFDYRGAGEQSIGTDSVQVTIGLGGSNTPIVLNDLVSVRFGFAGFVSTTPFTQVLFGGGGGTAEDQYFVNNAVTYGGLGQPDPTPGAQVPLPAGLPLMAGGLLAFGLLRRRG